MPSAASLMSAGTAVEPGDDVAEQDQQRVAGERDRSAVVRDSPVYGTRNANAASDGIV